MKAILLLHYTSLVAVQFTSDFIVE